MCTTKSLHDQIQMGPPHLPSKRIRDIATINEVLPVDISSYETDPYETIDATSPNGQTKLKSGRSHPRSANSAIYGITGAMSSTKNGACPPRSNAIIPYQTNSNSRKPTTIATDIYATVNKPSKKEMPGKQTSNISQVHKNKYKF